MGSLMGYLGGKYDLVGSRFVEVIEMTPQLLLLITIISIFAPSMVLLIVFSFIFDWTPIYHQMRAQFLQIRNREFVEAARALGASHWRIISKHILPNALTPLVTFSPFAIAANISGLALLDYLGLGLKAPTPSWGELMSQSQKYFTTAEWLVWYPSAALLITMVAMINIGLAVRDAYDSKA
jgi:microcin C transport system permease protein